MESIIPERICRIVTEATDRVPMYKQFKGAQLRDLPIIRKREYRSRYADFISCDVAPDERDLILRKVGELGSQVPSVQHKIHIGRVVLERSSGTTGPCVYYPRTQGERLRALLEVSRERRQIDEEFSPDRFLDLVSFFESRSIEKFPDRMSLLTNHVLMRLGRCYVHGAIGMLDMLAARMLAEGIKSEIAVAEIGGEFPDRERLQRINAVLKAKIVSQYACREAWTIGYDAELTNIYRLSKNAYVEIVDERGNTILEPEVTGSIVVSSALFSIFPILRFQTGDFGHWCKNQVGRALTIEDERRQCGMRMPDGTIVSGIRLVKAAVDQIKAEIGPPISGDWKVRKSGNVLRFFVEKIDAGCKSEIERVLAERFAWLCPRVEVVDWTGWSVSEKQIVYIDEDASPVPTNV